jgi:hypothetical protein
MGAVRTAGTTMFCRVILPRSRSEDRPLWRDVQPQLALAPRQSHTSTGLARIAVRPTWVGLLDVRIPCLVRWVACATRGDPADASCRAPSWLSLL